jgi:endoglucanase
LKYLLKTYFGLLLHLIFKVFISIVVQPIIDMKKLSFLIVAILGIMFQSQAQLSKVTVEGNSFMKDGKPFVFRGLNTADPDNLEKGGHWNDKLFSELESWGANIVRFPVHPRAWRSRGEQEYLKLLDRGIDLAEKHGMHVIIDWHSIGNLRTQMYQSEGYETTHKETFEFWRTISKKYKDNTTVAFFELFNEPTTYNGQLGSCTWAQWKELNEEMIGIIRAHGATAIPLVAGFNWAYNLEDVKTNPINAKGIGYVSHPYPQKTSDWNEGWEKNWAYVAKTYPLILTEIGFCLEGERGAHIPVISDESYGEAITKFTAERGISWVGWVFDDRWAPAMFNNWDNFEPTTQGKYFKGALRKYNGLK